MKINIDLSKDKCMKILLGYAVFITLFIGYVWYSFHDDVKTLKQLNYEIDAKILMISRFSADLRTVDANNYHVQEAMQGKIRELESELRKVKKESTDIKLWLKYKEK